MNKITLIKLSVKVLLFFLFSYDLQSSLFNGDQIFAAQPLFIASNQSAGPYVNHSASAVPASHLAHFNRNIDADLTFYVQQLELVNEFKLNLENFYRKHFKENVKVRPNRTDQNLTKFVFNKRCLFGDLKNSTYKTVYRAYLHDLQVAFNQFELLAQKLEHLIWLTAKAKDKINREVCKAENYVDNGLGEPPIKHTLLDYTHAIAKEIGATKEQIKFHFFNFFFLTKLLLAKEKWIASSLGGSLGPIHQLAFSNRTFQIRIIDLISQKQYLERV